MKFVCVFINDNEEKMQVKQITDWIGFGEIKTATTTLIACFISISHPFLNLHRILTGPLGYITDPIPISCLSYTHTNRNPLGIPTPTAALSITRTTFLTTQS